MTGAPRLIAAAALLASMCAAAGAGSLVVAVTDKEGYPVTDAVVVVDPVTRLAPARGAGTSAIVTQEKMRFEPALTVVQVGAKVTFVNNDVWEHHVRGSAAGLQQFAAGNAGGFEFHLDGRPAGKPGRSAEVVLDKRGPVLLGCYIHGSMKGHIYVSDSPWAQKTEADGTARFDDLPNGVAQIRVWHAEQLLDLPARTLELGVSAQRVEARLQVVPRRRRL